MDNYSVSTSNVMLIVEDDPDALEMLSDYGRQLGYEVLTARNGREAYRLVDMRRATHGRPNVKVIISDWMMKGGDGLRLLIDIRNGPYHNIPFILISGAVNPEQLNQAVGFDADGVLLKPFTLELLQQKIHESMHRRELKEARKIIDALGVEVDN